MLSEHGFLNTLSKPDAGFWEKISYHCRPSCPTAVPVLLFGDECMCKGSNYMTLTWMAATSKFKKDSLCSRHLLTLIPADLYVIDDDGVNLTLQSAMEQIVLAFNHMATEGRCGVKLQVIGCKGDWKLLKQGANLKRYYNSVSICHLCLADRLENKFTGIRAQAPWRQTIGTTVPWDRESALCLLPQFGPHWLWPDMLHVYFLGVARDIVASTMAWLLRSRFWPGRSLKKRLKMATDAFKMWLKANKLGGIPRSGASQSRSSI